MSRDINRVTLVGRLTRDAELRYTSGGTPNASFSLAVNRSVKKGDQWTDEASFFDVILWGKMGESLAKYLLKGSQIAVDGELRQERWEKDGQKHSKVQIVADTIQLLGGKRDSQSPPAQGQRPAPTLNTDVDPSVFEDEIPF